MTSQEFKTCRLALDLTQTQMAEALHIGFRTVQRIEAGEDPTYLMQCAVDRVMIDALRADEMDEVILINDNPDFNGQPNCCVSVGWLDTSAPTIEIRQAEYRADTITHCLIDALYARKSRLTLERKQA